MDAIEIKRNWLITLIQNPQGQSAVEYLIVCSCIVAALVTAPSLYNTFSHTMANKYKSYAFGVAISEPPSKEFDDKEQKVTEVVHIVREILDATGDLVKDILGISKGGPIPPIKAVEKFVETLKSIFSKK